MASELEVAVIAEEGDLGSVVGSQVRSESTSIGASCAAIPCRRLRAAQLGTGQPRARVHIRAWSTRRRSVWQ